MVLCCFLWVNYYFRFQKYLNLLYNSKKIIVKEYVVLVDRNNKSVGLMEKIEAHKKGLLHRAFSIFIFNSKGELLIQQRALSKYHSQGLWSNTCCSHPHENENVETGAHRRLKEEMGFDCELKEVFSFVYKAEVDKGFIEHEFDHVFVGEYDGEPKINHAEVAKWKFVNPEILKKEIKNYPDKFTEWFKIAFKKVS